MKRQRHSSRCCRKHRPELPSRSFAVGTASVRAPILEDENRKLKKLVADQALDMMVLASISCATRAKPLVSAQGQRKE
jgi:hypothetical protein